MRVVFRNNPKATETIPAMVADEAMQESAFRLILDAHKAIYDKHEPLQDSDANGLLYVDSATGEVVTQAVVDAAASAPSVPGQRRSFVKKVRPRTDSEIWQLMTARTVAAWWHAARRYRKEVADAASDAAQAGDVSLPPE